MSDIAKRTKGRNLAFPKAGRVPNPELQVPYSATEVAAMEEMFLSLYRHYGPQNWWPAENRFEVVVGAYLIQNTSWTNVERALGNLRRERVLSISGMRRLSVASMEELLLPSGYFRQKTRYLRAFIKFVDENHQGSLRRLLQQPVEVLKSELLALPGVGEETADVILLYAAQHKTFVMDAYARRIVERHGMKRGAESAMKLALGAAAEILGTAIAGAVKSSPTSPMHPKSTMSCGRRPLAVQAMNEAHALLVRVGSEHCRSIPRCESCPLRSFLPEVSTPLTCHN